MRNLHLWFAAGLGVLLATFAAAVLRIALAESLWLDELHTSWSVSGAWQEIASRAAAGNQTPLYFWLVGVLSQTLGHSNNHQAEWVLRLPSVVAWLLTISLVGWQVHSQCLSSDSRNRLFAMSIVAWIVLDRLQWFFASEARPYALVQLFSLAGWCCVEAIVRGEGRPSRKIVVAWSLLSIANIYWHLTAVLPVLFQWLTAWVFTGRCARGKWPHATTWMLAAAGVALALLPILQLAFPVWQRRQQWVTFASDVSLYRATTMFPFGPVLLCVLVGFLVDHLCRSKHASQATIASEVRYMWWIAMLGPWLAAWALTAFGIAPMFHQRYVFASNMPLFIVGAMELLRCRRWSIRWATCLAVAALIPFSQGSTSIWCAGYLVGNLRGEDWRGATQWVKGQSKPDEPLLCSSGLIEASASSSIRLPLDPSFAEYLSFPLLGIYQVASRVADSNTADSKTSVTPLLGDHRQWAAQVVERLTIDSTPTKRMWLFYRGAPGRLKTKLGEFQADMQTRSIKVDAGEPVRFGSVYVVELKW